MYVGPARIRTWDGGFKVHSINHYTTRPPLFILYFLKSKGILKWKLNNFKILKFNGMKEEIERGKRKDESGRIWYGTGEFCLF